MDINFDPTKVPRAAVMGAGMAADIVVNYPLWIFAKRVGAGLPGFPPLRSLYKGGGMLWLSLGPNVAISDAVAFTLKEQGTVPPVVCASAGGPVGAILVASQVENLIAQSHVEISVPQAALHLVKSRGASSVLLPPGMLMMAGRELPFGVALFYVQPSLSRRFSAEGQSPTIYDRALCGLITSCVTTPFGHVPSVIAAYQQGQGVGLRQAVKDLTKVDGWRGLWRGLLPRTVSLAGSMTVIPIVIGFFGKTHE